MFGLNKIRLCTASPVLCYFFITFSVPFVPVGSLILPYWLKKHDIIKLTSFHSGRTNHSAALYLLYPCEVHQIAFSMVLVVAFPEYKNTKSTTKTLEDNRALNLAYSPVFFTCSLSLSIVRSRARHFAIHSEYLNRATTQKADRVRCQSNDDTQQHRSANANGIETILTVYCDAFFSNFLCMYIFSSSFAFFYVRSSFYWIILIG